MSETSGTVRRVVGWLTGDRRVEAEGKVEEVVGEVPSERATDEAEVEVKAEHGDYGRAVPSPAETDR